MKKLFLAIVFGWIYLVADVSQVKGEETFILAQDTLNYKWNIVKDKIEGDMYLYVAIVATLSKKTLLEKKYLLEPLIFCKSELGEEDECSGTGVAVVTLPSYPNPLIILKAIKGAHSQTLKIYDPYKSTAEPIAEYFGAYFVDYKIGKEHIDITYDEYCDKVSLCERKIYWR